MMNDQVKDMKHEKETAHQLFEQYGNNLPPDARKKLEEAFVKMKEEHLLPKDAFGFTPSILEDLYGLGYNFYKAGKYHDALTIFTFLRLLDFADVRYSFGMAACCQYLQDYKTAAAHYLMCNTLDPLNPIPPFHMYDCLMKMDRPIAALQALQTALVIAGRDSKYDVLKEKILIELESLKEHIKTTVSKEYDKAA